MLPSKTKIHGNQHILKMAAVVFTKNRQRELSTSSLFFKRSQVVYLRIYG
jgi:hypothetical protein